MSEEPAAARVRLDDLVESVCRSRASALDRLTGAVQLADQLEEVSAHLVGHFVDEARRQGASWAAIGRAMGVTKQAAQKRFVAKPGLVDADLDQRLARFTERARRAVAAAHDAARLAANDAVTPTHLVLGLVADPKSVAAKIITTLGLRLQAVRTNAVSTLPATVTRPPDRLRYDADAAKVLELASREALRLGCREVGTEHVLLALLEHEREGGPLRSMGLRRADVEAQLR